MLYEKTLFGDEDKVWKAIERIIDAYNFSQSLGLGKLWVCFSGGKDSVCLYGVVKKAAEKVGIPLLDFAELHYNVTGVDPPELVQFIKEEFPFVHRDLHKESMWQLIVRNGMPPSRWSRYCCAELKEKGGDGRFCATGVRWAESTQRKSRGEFENYVRTKAQKKILFEDNDEDRRQLEHCIPKQKYIVNPIIDFTDEDVWQFIREENLPYCKLYDQGWKRLGCIGCPMAGGKKQQEEFAKYPKFRDAYIRAFDRMLVKRKERGLETKWQTGQEVYDWWVGNQYDKDEANDLFNYDT
jgi:phosphoadenosine phosphosulfate reductase